jgi:hypothetical protein
MSVVEVIKFKKCKGECEKLLPLTEAHFPRRRNGKGAFHDLCKVCLEKLVAIANHEHRVALKLERAKELKEDPIGVYGKMMIKVGQHRMSAIWARKSGNENLARAFWSAYYKKLEGARKLERKIKLRMAGLEMKIDGA